MKSLQQGSSVLHFLLLLKIHLVIGQQAYVQLHQQTLGGCYQAMNVTVKVFHEMLLGKG